jgi:O-antigen ligase
LIGGQKLDINQFADSLLVPLAISIVAGVRTRSPLLKGCALAAVCTILYAVSLAASREAFVAVAFMLVYFAWALRERAQIFGLAGLLSAVALANQNLLNRFLIASASGGSGRFSIWTAGIAAFREHWLVGAGAGSFATAYDAVYLKVFQRYDMGWSRAAHNMLLQNSVEYGVIGMSVLATAFCLTLMSVSRMKREHPAYGLKVSAVGGLIALCIAGLFIDLTTAKMFWLTIALIAQVRQHLPATTKHQECVIRTGGARSEFSLR